MIVVVFGSCPVKVLKRKGEEEGERGVPQEYRDMERLWKKLCQGKER